MSRRPTKSDPRWNPTAVGLAVFLLNRARHAPPHEDAEDVEGPLEHAGNTVIAVLGLLGLLFAVYLEVLR